MKLHILIFLSLTISSVFCFMVGVDFNTYSTDDLNSAIKYFGHTDFTWAITLNSPGVSASTWASAFAGTNKVTVFS